MPKVYSQKANKDYPSIGVKKGDIYYKWAFRFGGEHKSAKYPRPSQLTQSKMSGAYAAQEALEDSLAAATCIDDITSAISDACDAIRDVANEYEESLSNMPEGLQQGPTGEEIQEKVDGLYEWADQLESSSGEVEALDIADYVDVDARKAEVRATVEEAAAIEHRDLELSPITDEEVDANYELLPSVDEFDGLSDDERSAFLEAARELIDTSCPF